MQPHNKPVKDRNISLWVLNQVPKELPNLLACLTEGKGTTNKLLATFQA